MPGYLAKLKILSEAQRVRAIDAKIADSYHVIIDSAEVASAITTPHATGFCCDEYELGEIELLEDECTVEISWRASGERDLDKPFSCDRVSGTALAIIDDDGRVFYRNIEAEGG